MATPNKRNYDSHRFNERHDDTGMISRDGTETKQDFPDGLAATIVDSDAAIQTTFDLFRDDPDVLAVELDAENRVVCCNKAYLDASGLASKVLADAFPPDLLWMPDRANSMTPESRDLYPYLIEESWLRERGSRCSVRWFKLWTCPNPGKRYLKLGFYEVQTKDEFEYQMDGSVQLQTFLDAASDAIITINTRGTIVAVNPATEKLFDFERSELIGRNVSILMPSPYRERHDEYISRYLETGSARVIGTGREVFGCRKDGSTFPARLSLSEFKSHGRTYFTGMLLDLTERVETEEQQRALFAEHAHASRVVALGEMASSIAHEINQPLAAIVSFADASRNLLQTNRGDTETLKRALRQISEQGERAGEIIRRLREFVRKKAPSRSSLDINSLINTAIDLTSHDAERHGVSLKAHFETNPLHALVDRLQIEQVVLNLIRNSIESINESGCDDGEISIRSNLEKDMLVISVSDNGTGISPAERSNVFQPFYTTKPAGTGLGLSISQSIAEAHGGKLSFKPNPAQGVTFTLRLPTHIND